MYRDYPLYTECIAILSVYYIILLKQCQDIYLIILIFFGKSAEQIGGKQKSKLPHFDPFKARSESFTVSSPRFNNNPLTNCD